MKKSTKKALIIGGSVFLGTAIVMVAVGAAVKASLKSIPEIE